MREMIPAGKLAGSLHAPRAKPVCKFRMPNNPPFAQMRVLSAVTLLASAAALFVLLPLWVPLVLAAWFAELTTSLTQKLESRLGTRARAAAVSVFVFCIVVLTPLTLAVAALASDASRIVELLRHSSGLRTALQSLASEPGAADSAGFDAAKWIAMVRQYGSQGWSVLGAFASASAKAVIGVFTFVLAAYTCLVDGKRAYAWARERAPLRGDQVDRLAAAFAETGRGLVVGVGLTALVQGVVSGIAYLALGVPRALVFGFVTCIAAVIPNVGTALVWIPVAAGLALSGDNVRALVLVGLGVGVIGTVDNVLRPILTSYGRLNLPAFVVLISMVGGLGAVGAWGILVGPLVVRIAVECLEMRRTERAFAAEGQ